MVYPGVVMGVPGGEFYGWRMGDGMERGMRKSGGK